MLALQLSDGIQMVAVSLGKGLGTVFLEAAQAHQQGYKNPLPSLNSKTVNLFSFKEWNKKKKKSKNNRNFMMFRTDTKQFPFTSLGHIILGRVRNRERKKRKREKACISVSSTQNQVPRLPSSKVYHAPESASTNKRPFSGFSSKSTKKSVSTHPTPSMLKETNTLISSQLMPISVL